MSNFSVKLSCVRAIFLIILGNFSKNGETARILGVFPLPATSHFMVFEKIMIELAKKGHEVDVYGHFPLKNPVKGTKLSCVCAIFLIVLGNLSKNGESARILGIFPFPGKSHFTVHEKIMIELAKKGHEIDVYGHFPLKNPVKGYNDHSLVGTMPIITGTYTLEQVISWNKLFTVLDIMTGPCGTNLCESLFKSQQLIDLKNSTKKYDLLVTEMFGTDCMLGFAHHFGIPSILVESAPHYAWTADYVGLPDNPSYIPNYHAKSSPRMTFYERLTNTITLLAAKIHYRYHSIEPSTRLAREFFGPELPHLDTLLRNVSLDITNSHLSINQARPLPPNVIEVGGIHIEEPKPLNSHFSNLVENLEPDQKGVIYFTLGSLVQTTSLPDAILQGMFNAFEKLPYRILWKARKENFSKNLRIPKNIRFEWWMPQFDILCHPNVKLYISHGGNAGVEESVFCGVPMVGIPLFGDQELNVAQLVGLGVALKLNIREFDETKLYTSANEVLNNPKYQEAAKKVQHNFKDRPLSPKESATYWIEYVIRHHGAPELRSTSMELSWYQYYLLDVIFVSISVLALTFYLLFVLLRFIYKKSRRVVKQKTK